MAQPRYEPFLTLYLLIASGALYYLFALFEFGAQTQAGEAMSYRLLWVVLYVVLLIKIVGRANITYPLLASSKLLILFLLSATFSAVLNASDVQALLKFGMYSLTILGACWLASFNSVDRVLDTFLRVGIIVLVLHSVAYLLIGTKIIEYDLERYTILQTAAYGGLFPHKNLAATFFGLSALVCLAGAIARTTRRTSYLILMLLHLVMLSWAGAAGPLLSVIVAMAALFLIRIIARRQTQLGLVCLFPLAPAALVLAIFAAPFVLELVGRDAELTGRVSLWSAWSQFFWERPLFGYGYSSFFSDHPDSPAWVLWSLLPWEMKLTTFHNAYLEAMINYGIVGSLFFFLILAKAVVEALRYASHSCTDYAAAPFVMIVFLLASALGESSLVLHNYVACVVVFWCYFGLEASFSSNQKRASRALNRWGEGNLAVIPRNAQ